MRYAAFITKVPKQILIRMPESTTPSANIIRVAPGARLRGDFQLPGDKSISHRSAMFAAIGEGVSRLKNYSSARDCQSTLDCLEALGAQIRREPELIVIEGAGMGGLREPERALDAGNSGSTIRMLSGILAGQNFTTEITGDESVRRRPMKRVIDPLALMGARVEAREGGFAPLVIRGGGLKAIEYTPPVASAQVKSCALLAGLFADGVTTVIEKTPTRNHTEVMMRECGAVMEVTKAEAGERISVEGRHSL